MMEREFAISFLANVNLEKMGLDRGGWYGEGEGRRECSFLVLAVFLFCFYFIFYSKYMLVIVTVFEYSLVSPQSNFR